jgi:hypothetical protein
MFAFSRCYAADDNVALMLFSVLSFRSENYGIQLPSVLHVPYRLRTQFRDDFKAPDAASRQALPPRLVLLPVRHDRATAVQQFAPQSVALPARSLHG